MGSAVFCFCFSSVIREVVLEEKSRLMEKASESEKQVVLITKLNSSQNQHDTKRKHCKIE